MVYIYVLKLRQNKYYIGKTKSPINRLDDHCNFGGSKWTQKYNPVEIIEVIPNCEDSYENEKTLEYMVKYGWENVRGGSWCKVNMSGPPSCLIESEEEEEIVCYRCGRPGHYASQCYARTSVKQIVCYRCRRPGHYASQCGFFE